MNKSAAPSGSEPVDAMCKTDGDGREPRAPKVSICLPCLNAVRYLDERIASILGQTFSDWELIVCDGFSSDGSWEKLLALADSDDRVMAFQLPASGPYPAWNEAVLRATGEYVYIATADDTMPSNCLDELVRALDKYLQCGLAHAPLRILDERGRFVDEPRWVSAGAFALSQEKIKSESSHLRYPPYDAFLHLAGKSVYVSITQCLIRRATFESVGLFDANWRSIGDVLWMMKATTIHPTVHVPTTWGGYRKHPNQLTAKAAVGSLKHHELMDALLEDGLRYLTARWAGSIPESDIRHLGEVMAEERRMSSLLKSRGAGWARHLMALSSALAGNRAARRYVYAKLLRRGGWRQPIHLLAWRLCRKSLGKDPIRVIPCNGEGFHDGDTGEK